MNPIRYATEELVEVGDFVEIKGNLSNYIFDIFTFNFHKRTRVGVVVYVYNPNLPSPPWGNNDYGVTIQVARGCYLFGGVGVETKLIKRKQ